MFSTAIEELRIDCSIYKITSGSNVILCPKFNLESSEPIIQYNWSIGNIDSTFKEHKNYTSYATKTNLTPLNQKNIFIKISNVSDEEVCFIPVNLTVRTSSNVYSASASQAVYRGIPRTLPLELKIVRNGRLAATQVFDGQIERRIYNANKNREFLSKEDSINQEKTFKNIKDHLSTDDQTDNFTDINFPSHPSQIYPDTTAPDSYLPGRQASSAKAGNKDRAIDKAMNMHFGRLPGYSSVPMRFGNPHAAEYPIDIPGRSTHLVQTSMLGTPPRNQPSIVMAIPYPCGGSCECDSETSTEIETDSEDEEEELEDSDTYPSTRRLGINNPRAW